MANFRPMDDEDEALLMSGDDPDEGDDVPVDTIAGPQTLSSQVKERIANVRNPALASEAPQSPPPAAAAPIPAPSPAAIPAQYQVDPEAQSRADEMRMRAGLGRAVNALAAGTGYKPDNSFYDSLDKDAEKGLDRAALVKKAIAQGQLKTQQMQDMKDYRDKSLAVKQHLADAAASRISDAADSKQDAKDTKRFDELAAKLDSSGARAGNFGKSGAMVQAADRIDALFKQYPDGNIPKSQTTELATAVAAMVGGGSVQSQHQLDSVTPSSVKGDLNATIGWLMNEPRGLEQQAFMKNLQESAAREREVAQDQIDEIRAQRLGSYNDLAKRNPDKFNQIIRAAHMDPSNYDQASGQYTIPKKAKDVGGGFPRKVTKGTQSASVSNEQELKEALAEGWK